MRNIKLFEQYKEDIHDQVLNYRTITNQGSIGHRLSKLTSFFRDILNFNFSLIPHKMRNKSGYNKLMKLIDELNVLEIILDRTNGDVDFEDLYKYGLDDSTLLYIDDNDVKEYLQRDPKVFNKLYTHKYINLFTEYSDWKKEHGLHKVQESHNSYEFKTIHYYSCEECGGLSKSKDGYEVCPKCNSDRIVTMNEVDWYKQVD